jgi:20S proteasome subunit beta 5
MLSDLVDLDDILEKVSFEGRLGSPLKPFQQLMGCMPPSQAHHIPEPYRWLMTDPRSPIIDFYPKAFTIDMNGKRWPWEAVALLPFLDSRRLLDAYEKIDDSSLTEQEMQRNLTGNTVVMMFDPAHSESIPAIGENTGFGAIEDSKVISIPFGISDWNYSSDKKAVLEPVLHQDVQVPLPGFSSLRDAPVQSLWRRKNGINVFGGKSRYKTSCLELSAFMPPLPPLENLAPKLIGTSIFVNYPHFVEALITAVSDEHTVVRGRNKPRRWTEKESEKWRVQRDGITRRFEIGEGYTGTGGMIIPDDQSVTLSVRPLEGLVETKDGITVKSYAKFEIEVPILSTFWNPSRPDPRLAGVPSRLEKNAFEVATPLHSAEQRPTKTKPGRSRKKLFPPKAKSTMQTAKPEVTDAVEVGNVAKAYYSSSALSPLHKNQQCTSLLSGYDLRGKVHHGRRQSFQQKDESGKRQFSSFVSDFRPQLWNRSASSLSSGLFDVSPNLGRKSEQLKRLNTQSSIAINTRAVPRTATGPRGRMLAIGFIAASFLVNLGGAVSTQSVFVAKSKKDSKSFGVPDSSQISSLESKGMLLVRGGDFEVEPEMNNGPPPLEFAHGTTTLSYIFQGGIIAAVDSRATLGSFVGSKTTQKVLPVNSHILGTMAGGAADCMFWIRKLKSEAMLHELIEGYRMTVARASRLLSNALYENRGLDLSVGTMIMGFDPEDGPPRIYYVDNTGVRIEGDLFAVGSGSTFALGILDSERRYGMTEREAIQLGIKAIRHATFRDAYSGGFINVYLITKDGWKKVYTEDLAGKSPKSESLQIDEEAAKEASSQ